MGRTVQPKEVLIYADEAGHEPFTAWLNRLRDRVGRQRILARLRRLEQGNFGDCKSLGEGMYELRVFFGPGYRVYFGEDGNTIVVLLTGGDKRSQVKDVANAKKYWKEYQSHAKA